MEVVGPLTPYSESPTPTPTLPTHEFRKQARVVGGGNVETQKTNEGSWTGGKDAFFTLASILHGLEAVRTTSQEDAGRSRGGEINEFSDPS
jgi:hypothetical protein